MTVRPRHVLAAALPLFVWIACGGGAEYGEPCSAGSECIGQVCINGTCAGEECTCPPGVAGACPGDTGCPSGYACLGPGTGPEYAFPRCFRTCDDARGCPRGEVCSSGTCRYGADKPVLEWVGLPRAVRCQAGGPCPFEVKVVSGPAPDDYQWLVDADPAGQTTKEPRIELRLTSGPHKVVVLARKGTVTGRLETLESTCVTTTGCGGELSIECCAGTCALDGTCR